GDNYNGFRIIGTNEEYLKHYNASIKQGRSFEKPMEVIVGSEVAKRNNLKINDKIIGAHGLINDEDLHKDSPYIVIGIIAQSGSVLDNLVLTSIESVWQVHEHHENEEDATHKKIIGKKEDKEITALLINYKSPLAAATLPALVNKTSSMQSASPALEMARLNKFMGIGGDVIKIFAIALIVIAASGFFMTLFNSVKDRSYDIALLRILGATRTKIFGFILTEGIVLGVAGTIIGLIFGHLLTFLTVEWIAINKNIMLESSGFIMSELLIVLSAILISIIASLIPALIAYRKNVAKLLAKNI
ncbi:MAG: FtsX-like permease family protein, partial [Pseudomonadota bacterium]